MGPPNYRSAAKFALIGRRSAGRSPAVMKQKQRQLLGFLGGRENVAAEVEGWADGVAIGPSAIGDDVVEGMIPYGVHLGADTEVLGDREVGATAYAVGSGPVGDGAVGLEDVGRDECRDDSLIRGARARMRGGFESEGCEAGADEERHLGEVTVVELRASSEGLRGCAQRNVDGIGWRKSIGAVRFRVEL